jgi:uncharacterized tellurite resistance protein B-like protein
MEQYISELLLFISILFFGILVVRSRREPRVNIPEEVSFLSPLKVRIVQGRNGKGLHFINVQFRGEFPVDLPTDLAFVISVFTKDKNGKIEPVLSVIDTFQKPGSTVFQDFTKIGEVHKNTGCENWTPIGVIPTEILQPAFGGKQQLKIHTMLIDVDNPPKTFEDKGLVLISLDYTHNFKIDGFHEEGLYINESRVLSIKLGVAVAFSDGILHEKEKTALDDWISKMIQPYNREDKIRLKGIYHGALKEAYKLAKDNNLDVEGICKELYRIGEEAQNYEALDLVHEIMVADQEVHPKEVEIIKDIAIFLGIDNDELNYIRRHKISKLNKPLTKK